MSPSENGGALSILDTIFYIIWIPIFFPHNTRLYFYIYNLQIINIQTGEHDFIQSISSHSSTT